MDEQKPVQHDEQKHDGDVVVHKLGATLKASGVEAPATVDAFGRILDLVSVVKTQISAGWNPTTSVPPLLTAAISDIVPLVQGISSIKDEFALGAPFYKAVASGLIDIAMLFVAAKTLAAAAHHDEHGAVVQTIKAHA